MINLIRTSRLRTAAATTAAGLAACACVIAAGGTAYASTSTLRVTYPVTGSTYLAAPGATVALGPGTLKSKVNLDTLTFTAKLSLPDATGSFNELGLVPVTATTQFINDGPTTGTINADTGAITSTSLITLKIVSLSVAGINDPVGNKCETSTPITIQVASQPGFSIISGGNLAGTYTIPDFANCELSTVLINLTLPGPNNTITLTLGAAQKG
jgi:hypothetical protein